MRVRPAIEIVADPAAAAAERVAAAVRAGGHVALTGGSTPRRAYERLAAATDLDWGATELWLGDDRCVPADDERSNFGMVQRELIDGIPEGRGPLAWHPTHGELGPRGAAEALAADLRRGFGDVPLPIFDLILLGMGPDAHTASLFPGKPEIDVRDRWVVGVEEAGMEPFVPRVTLTLPVLCAARAVVFLVSGPGKAEAVQRAFGGDDPGPGAPAGLVRPVDGNLTVLLDEPAAARLDLPR